MAIEAVCQKKESKEEVEKTNDLFDKNLSIKVENESMDKESNSQLDDSKFSNDNILPNPLSTENHNKTNQSNDINVNNVATAADTLSKNFPKGRIYNSILL